MNTAWKGSLLSVAIALAACDHSPTVAPPPPSVRGAPTAVATRGVERHGRVVVASGSDADTLVRHTAARWAANGRHGLQTYVDSSGLWDGPSRRPAASINPLPPPDDGSGYTDLSYLQASLGGESLQITLSGNQALVVSKSAYAGTDAHTDLSFGANYASGAVDIPEQTAGANDGHALQKAVCASELTGGGLFPADCMAWAGTVTVTARLVLSHDCGEYVYGSATTSAWFELPVPDVSLGSGGMTVKWGWKRFGSTGPVATGRNMAYQPSCQTVIKKTPTCFGQLISDPSGCDGASNGSTLDPLGGSSSGNCQLYLVQVEESYDGGKTWVVVNSWIQTIC